MLAKVYGSHLPIRLHMEEVRRTRPGASRTSPPTAIVCSSLPSLPFSAVLVSRRFCRSSVASRASLPHTWAWRPSSGWSTTSNSETISTVSAKTHSVNTHTTPPTPLSPPLTRSSLCVVSSRAQREAGAAVRGDGEEARRQAGPLTVSSSTLFSRHCRCRLLLMLLCSLFSWR